MVCTLINARRLENYRFDGEYLIVVDGTELHRFKDRDHPHCEDCLKQTHTNGATDTLLVQIAHCLHQLMMHMDVNAKLMQEEDRRKFPDAKTGLQVFKAIHRIKWASTFACKKQSPGTNHESTAAMISHCCGSAPSGLTFRLLQLFFILYFGHAKDKTNHLSLCDLKNGIHPLPHRFTPIERRVLTRIQWNFPFDSDPYRVVAQELGLSPSQVFAAVCSLRASGVIRRVGGSFVPKRLGYVSVLVAGCVEPSQLEAVAETATGFPEVTHNYERQDRYNLWFTVIAGTQARLEAILSEVRRQDGVAELHALPALKTFKIRVDFNMGGDRAQAGAGRPPTTRAGGTETAGPEGFDAYPLDDLDRRIIPRCCGDIGDSEYPFSALANELALPETLLLSRLSDYLKSGVLRRFGAILRHQAAGFVANGMSIWNVPDGETERMGRIMSEFPEISHCYERPRFEGWPYNLFGMIHAGARQECLAVARRVGDATGIDDYRVLFSVREFKKTSMVYAMPAPVAKCLAQSGAE